jgi:hypothetical protein
MKAIVIACGLFVVLLHVSVKAQTQTEYELAHRAGESKRQVLVAANLPLLDSEAEAFWKLYLEYRSAAKEADDNRANLIRRLAGSIEDLNNKEGQQLVTDALRVEEKRQDIKKRYFNKFKRILPGQRLFRYYQIETKLDAIARHDWTQMIPLAPATQ